MALISPTAHRLLALSNLSGIGPVALAQIAQAPDFLTSSIDALAALTPKLQKALEVPSAWAEAQSKAAANIEQAKKHSAQILCTADPGYPDLLRAAKTRPFFLYVKGSFPADQAKSIAIIGTRNPTEHGRITCARITALFGEEGWSIVSGLALGLDAVAHTSALAAGAHTVAVMAHGLHTVAPKQHQQLAEDILASGGALVSEFPFGMEPAGHQFVQRDRTQAGLAKGVVMVQSATDGGSLHASRAALQYGRHLIVPSPTERDRHANEPSIGANLLFAGDDDSAKAALLKCAQDDLARLVILRSRDDYPGLLAKLADEAIPAAHVERQR